MTEDADAGEQERHAAERRDEPRAQAIGTERLVPDVLDGPDLGQRLVRIDLDRGRLEPGHHGCRGTRRPDNHARRRSAAIGRAWRTSPGSRPSQQSDALVGDDADNLPRHGLPELAASRKDPLDEEVAANRIDALEVSIGERLVDDDDRCGRGRVSVLEPSTAEDWEADRGQVQGDTILKPPPPSPEPRRAWRWES